jgi:prepilin-type N-terminal cleavage/methylation domain-containing protein
MKKSKKSKQKGFTLIELLVGLVLTGFVLIAIYNIFISQYKSYLVQDSVAETQQNARAALNRMVKDIRMAGYGVTDGTDFVITATNGSVDSITFNANIGGASTYLTAEVASGDTTIDVKDSSDFVIGDNVNILDYKHHLIATATISDIPSGNELDVTGLAFESGFSSSISGNLVQTDFRTITYSINNMVLNRNTGGGAQPLAENIEDLQLVYAYDSNNDRILDTDASGDVICAIDSDGGGDLDTRVNDDGTTETLATAVEFSCIREIRINLVARTQKKDNDWSVGKRFAIFDNQPSTSQDDIKYRRRLLSTTIGIRNAGLL